jgi:hypothetical protein
MLETLPVSVRHHSSFSINCLISLVAGPLPDLPIRSALNSKKVTLIPLVLFPSSNAAFNFLAPLSHEAPLWGKPGLSIVLLPSLAKHPFVANPDFQPSRSPLSRSTPLGQAWTFNCLAPLSQSARVPVWGGLGEGPGVRLGEGIRSALNSKKVTLIPLVLLSSSNAAFNCLAPLSHEAPLCGKSGLPTISLPSPNPTDLERGRG